MEKIDEIVKFNHPETFQIKVSLYECRQLALGTDDVPNPYIVLKVGDQTSQTAIQRENPDPIYNSVFDFQIVMTETELKTMKILISVMNNNKWYQRDSVIGTVSIDAWTVYNRPNHMINKAWAVLDREGVSEPGHVNYSVIVIGTSGKLLALRRDNEDDDNEHDAEGDNKKVTRVRELIQGLPPIEKKSYMMTINLYQGDFCELPWIKEFSSKVKIIVSEGNVTESTVISNSRTPGWKEQYSIPMRSPFCMTYIIVEIWQIQSGEKLFGKFVLDFGQLIKDGSLETRWYLIYGPERENSFMKKLKYQYKFGKEVEQHFYFGRVLVNAKWVADDNPAFGKHVTPEVQFPEERPYVFWLDVYELTSKLLSSSDQIFIECQVADKITTSKTAAQYNSSLTKFYWKNDKEIRFKEITLNLPVDISQIPDIFIRIKKIGGMFSEDEYIAYCRFRPQELIVHRANVKAKWQKLRMCKTQVKGDGDENYLGLLLCSINFFPKPDAPQPRPIVLETRNYKKYKLISIIYMANELPVLKKGTLPSPIVEVTFNGKTRRTKVEEGDNNPVYGEIMFISTYLNDCLDLSDNIRMEVVDKNGLISNSLGKTEIEVSKIQKYNSQNYIENELYKLAKWYHLYEGTRKLKAKVLAAFLIVKLTKQGREEIKLDNKSMWPDEEAYRLYIYILGVRGVPRNINLDGACVMAYINRVPLETFEDKEEFFKKHAGASFDNNFNVYDSIGDPGENDVHYIKQDLSTQREFVNPMSLIVFKDKKSLLTANVDLTNFFGDVTPPLSGLELELKLKAEKKNKKKKTNFNAMPEDVIPIYHKEGISEVERTRENNEAYIKTISKFPFEQEEANALVGEEITIHIYNPEYDKKGNLKKDDDIGGSYNRPDIDYEYEEEVLEKDLPFCTSPLQMSGEGEGEADYGIIRYVLKLVKDSDKDEILKVEEEFTKIQKELSAYKEQKHKCFFICRIYLLNTSNLTIEDSTVEEAFVWIKRWESDREWKDEKEKYFQVSSGEINQCYPLQVIYPETFFVTVQFHAVKKIIGLFDQHYLIGETKIDLERRYFHPHYRSKLENYKTFKQIPVESRTIQLNKQARGAVRMWVELLEKHREHELLPEILLPNTMDRYEMRLIIWNTRDIPPIDGGKVDILVKVLFNDLENDVEQQTDVHSDSKDGNGKFNWRIVIPFKYPNSKTSITISVFDNNLVGSNEMICSNVINIKKYLNRVHRTKTAVEFPRDWLPLKLSALAQSKGSFTSGGEVELEFKLLTLQEAESNKVGKGREEPNKDPYLETPKEGRSLLDKLSFIKDLAAGLGGFYDGIFRWLKIFGVIFSIAILAYVISILAKL